MHDLPWPVPASTVATVFLGIVPSALGYLVWSDAVSRTTIARSTVALYLVPVVAMGLSWVWLGERPTLLAVLGGALAVGGVVLVRRGGQTRIGTSGTASTSVRRAAASSAKPTA